MKTLFVVASLLAIVACSSDDAPAGSGTPSSNAGAGGADAGASSGGSSGTSNGGSSGTSNGGSSAGAAGTDAGASGTGGAGGTGGTSGTSGTGGTGGTGGKGGSAGKGGSGGKGGSTEPASIIPIPEAFAKACTGTLLVPMPIYVRVSSGMVEEADEPAPAGTVMMLTQFIADYEGIVLLSGNRTGTVKPSFLSYLKEGTHFTSDCLTEDVEPVNTLLIEAKVYAKKDLSGDACVAPQAMVFDSLSYSNTGEVIELESNDLKKLCGYAKAYAERFDYEGLLPRK